MAKKNAVTYGELTAAIRKLKYKRDPERSAEDHITFHRRGRRLPIILPVLEDSTPMRPIYVAVVRRILEESSDDDAEAFESLINGRFPSGSRRSIA
jgi:hypothetical protein